jgi:uncharacterized protein with GYD domain
MDGPGVAWARGARVAETFERQVQAMPTFITLTKWTDQGVRNVKETVQRTAVYRADLERRGGKVLSMYWTQGSYDMVTTIEAPDAQTATAALLAATSLGNIRTETFLAFSESEMTSIIQKL